MLKWTTAGTFSGAGEDGDTEKLSRLERKVDPRRDFCSLSSLDNGIPERDFKQSSRRIGNAVISIVNLVMS